MPAVAINWVGGQDWVGEGIVREGTAEYCWPQSLNCIAEKVAENIAELLS
ncbi:MAG: hypothetical protein ACI9WS_002729 [Paraglaciecola psychrophila]|jgi:hypothetical protein